MLLPARISGIRFVAAVNGKAAFDIRQPASFLSAFSPCCQNQVLETFCVLWVHRRIHERPIIGEIPESWIEIGQTLCS